MRCCRVVLVKRRRITPRLEEVQLEMRCAGSAGVDSGYPPVLSLAPGDNGEFIRIAVDEPDIVPHGRQVLEECECIGEVLCTFRVDAHRLPSGLEDNCQRHLVSACGQSALS